MSLLTTFPKTYSANLITFNHILKYNSHIGSTLIKRDFLMDEYLLGFNNNNDTIINLEKSLFLLRRSLNFLKIIYKSGKGQILFVGTTNKTKVISQHLGNSLDQPFVSGRWIKGLLTNWENISSSLKLYTLFFKKLNLSKKRKFNLEASLGGLKNLQKLPVAIVLLDLQSDSEIIKEAKRLDIPVIGLVDNTSSVIKTIDYPIVLNTKSLLSIFFVSSLIIQSLKK